MLYSYKNVSKDALPRTAAAFVAATDAVKATDGMILSSEALTTYCEKTGLDRDIQNLIDAVTDPESKERVDVEIKRRVVTGKIPPEVAGAITEAIEVLGMHSTELTVAEIPLCVVLYVEGAVTDTAPVVINITGAKGLADALRLIWSKIFVSPYPDTIRSAVAIYRMPPVAATAEVFVREDKIVVRAVHGWGLLVGEESAFDEYVLDMNSLRVLDVRVGRQERMVARNDRTGEVVLTTPGDGGAQKLTEEQIRGVASDAKRAGLSSAVFGVSGDRRWILRVLTVAIDDASREEVVSESFVPEEDEVIDVVDEPAVEHVVEESTVASEQDVIGDDVVMEESVDEPVTIDTPEDLSEEVVLDDVVDDASGVVESEELEDVVVEEPGDQPDEAVVEDVVDEPVVEEAVVAPSPPEEYVRAEYTRQPEDVKVEGQHVDDVISSTGSYQQAQQLSTALLMQCLKTIELTMREWLWDKDQPEGFVALVERVASKRVVPYKDRLLTLFEMKQAAALSEPEADSVRFALETMQRFVREF